LSVCLLAALHKKYSTDFHKIWCKGPWKYPLDFGGNPDHVT